MSLGFPTERELVESMLQAFKDEKMIQSFERPFRDRRGKWSFKMKLQKPYFRPSIKFAIENSIEQLREFKEKNK